MPVEIGETGQQLLSQARVLIIGAGGLGSPVALYLAGAGVGHITICDPDVVSISNLHRQILYDTRSEGKPKAMMAKQRLEQLNPEVDVRAISEPLTEANADRLIAEFDLVIDCTDNFATRFIIDRACRRASKPWIFGAIGEFSGQIALFGKSGHSLADLYPDLPLERPSVVGAIGPVAGVISSLQALEAIKVICNIENNLSGRLLVIDFLSLDFNIIEL